MSINSGDLMFCKNGLMVRVYKWGMGSTHAKVTLEEFAKHYCIGIGFIVLYTLVVSALLCLSLEFWLGLFWYDLSDCVSVIFGVQSKMLSVTTLRLLGIASTIGVIPITAITVSTWFNMPDRVVEFK